MIQESWKYKFTTADDADNWSYIQFSPENGFNPAWKVESHLVLQPSDRVKPMLIRHVGMHVIVGGPTVPHLPIAALYMSMHTIPNISQHYGEAELGMCLLQGTQGPTNWLFANFPRSLYMSRGLVIYVPTLGLDGKILIVNILWERTDSE